MLADYTWDGRGGGWRGRNPKNVQALEVCLVGLDRAAHDGRVGGRHGLRGSAKGGGKGVPNALRPNQPRRRIQVYLHYIIP